MGSDDTENDHGSLSLTVIPSNRHGICCCMHAKGANVWADLC